MYTTPNENGELVHQTIVAPIEKREGVQIATYEYRLVPKEIIAYKEEGKHEEEVIVPAHYQMPMQVVEPNE